MTFSDLGLGKKLLQAIEECGYTEPTPIQAQAIPLILMSRDLVGLAQTGTGKTASFTLPMIEILAGGRAKARMPRSLILAPTRELAAQVAKNFDIYGKHTKLSKALLVGGESMEEQKKLLNRGVDVLIATPGRLLDLFERGSILLSDIKILVIDEADRMLDMGFIPDIEKIVSLLSPLRQTLLFSATMPDEIKGLTKKFLSNPKEVSVAPPASPAKTVEQFLVWVKPRDKYEALDAIIQQEDVGNAFIFCNRKSEADKLARWLEKHNYAAKALHGDMPQRLRTETLERFKEGDIALLVCSDVAARGIDVAGLSHVFNFDIPYNSDDYVHRIGRTGRAGLKGRAWSLAVSDDDKYVEAIEKIIEKKIPVEEIDGFSVSASSSQSSSGGKAASKGGRSQKPRSKDQNSNERKGAGERAKSKANHNKSRSNRSGQRHEQENTPNGFGDEMPAFFGKK